MCAASHTAHAARPPRVPHRVVARAAATHAPRAAATCPHPPRTQEWSPFRSFPELVIRYASSPGTQAIEGAFQGRLHCLQLTGSGVIIACDSDKSRNELHHALAAAAARAAAEAEYSSRRAKGESLQSDAEAELLAAKRLQLKQAEAEARAAPAAPVVIAVPPPLTPTKRHRCSPPLTASRCCAGRRTPRRRASARLTARTPPPRASRRAAAARSPGHVDAARRYRALGRSVTGHARISAYDLCRSTQALRDEAAEARALAELSRVRDVEMEAALEIGSPAVVGPCWFERTYRAKLVR